MKSKAEDISDKAQAGQFNGIPKGELEPLTPAAKVRAEDEARVLTVRELLGDSFSRAVAPVQEQRVITTGHYKLDKDTGGYRKDAVWIKGGKSSFGKSSDLVMTVDENIKRGFRILIVTCEDGPDLYGDRLMIRRARVDPFRFQARKLNREERERVGHVVGQAEDVPVLLDSRGKSVEWAVKQARRLIRLEGVDLVAFDYLHAFDQEKPDNRNGDRRSSLNYIARTMTDLIKTEGKAGIIYAQITPDSKDDGRGNVPDMYCIRDSKDVVNAAEVVAIGFQPQVTLTRGQDTFAINERVFHLAKNKPGPAPKGGLYLMSSDTEHGCFDVTLDPDDRYRAFDGQFDAPLDDDF